MGMFLHFKTQETENDQLLDDGELGLERRLYYRELIARFGHHLALNWNLGEENTNTAAQQMSFSDFFKEIDPYHHPVVIHTFPLQHELVYRTLLGHGTFDGVSLQAHPNTIHKDTLKWVKESAAAGRKWVVANDEQNPPRKGVLPDANDPLHDSIRQKVLWGNIMAGGAGVEYYFGYNFDNSDLTCEDFRTRDVMWDQSRFALEFFRENAVPFWNMTNANEIVSGGANQALLDPDGSIVVVYFKKEMNATVDLSRFPETSYSIQWYDPRTGGALFEGQETSVVSDSPFLIERPSGSDILEDWVLLLRCESCRDNQETFEPTVSTVAPTTSPSQMAPTFLTALPTPSTNVTLIPILENATQSPTPSATSTMYPTFSNTTHYPSDSPTEITSDVPSSAPSDQPTGFTASGSASPSVSMVQTETVTTSSTTMAEPVLLLTMSFFMVYCFS